MNKRDAYSSGLLGMVGLVLGVAVAPVAGAAGDCWLDIYDQGGFQGKQLRIDGPRELSSLAKVNGENWGNRIDSLQVGPKAQVYAFRQEDFKDDYSGLAYHGDAIRNWKEDAKTFSDREITFGAGQKEHHLGELNFHRNINSLKILCVP
jgi:hypothetical protein